MPTEVEDALYRDLSREFDHTFTREVAGQSLTYITGEQAISRLNEELGFPNWDFVVVEHGIHAEADECWALGRLTVRYDGGVTIKDAFGSQKIKRSRSSGTPIEIGHDLKGAATDALKKCASLVGVALYLWKKEPTAQNQGGGYQHNRQNGSQSNGNQGGGRPPQNQSQADGGYKPAPSGFDGDGGAPLSCEECGEPLAETRFKDGTNWAPEQLASFGKRKHSRILCMKCYRQANEAKRQAEAAQGQTSF